MLSFRSLDVVLCGTLWAASLPTAAGQANVAPQGGPSGPAYLIVRSDDAGMSHSVNMALERLIASGIPVSVSVMFPTPWYQEAVEMLPTFRAIAERLAKEYGVGMAEYFGETRASPQYAAAPPNKGDSLVALISRLQAGVTLLVTHVGLDDAELGALVDMNTDGGLTEMSRNRQGELDALMSTRFRDAVSAGNVTLVTYRELIGMRGLGSMRRPGEGG